MLPLAVMLVAVLGISGLGFMQLDLLERRMTLGNVDNHAAFYLATAGLERARVTFKIDPIVLTWTSMLSDPALRDAAYPSDLCPFGAARGCAIPPFGMATGNPDIPFGGSFVNGVYDVRAFNDAQEPGTTDINQHITFRARAAVRGERKLLELTVKGISGLNLVNCAQSSAGEACPETHGNAVALQNLDGHDPDFMQDPDCGLAICLEPPLNDPGNYYRQPSNFPLVDRSAGFTGTFQNGSYYALDQNVSISSDLTDVVLFTTGDATVTSADLTNVTIVAQGDIATHGNINWSAFRAIPIYLPAILAGDTVSFGSGAVVINGNIYAMRSVSLNPITVYGVIIGDDVELQGSTLISDRSDPATYALMQGFAYAPDQLTTAPVGQSWREIE